MQLRTDVRSIHALFVQILILLALRCPAQGDDFTYITNAGAITITGYHGIGGAVTIPPVINGLPVTAIADSAFVRCSSVTSVNIPETVARIGNAAFYSCTSLSGITIPNSVVSIGDSAFGNSGVSDVIIGRGVSNIGSQAFFPCTSLLMITVDAQNSSFSSRDGILFDKLQTTLIQYPAKQTGSYTVPDSVTDIGSMAFGSCTGLTSVAMPNSVTRIEAGAFRICTGLASVTMPDGITRIEDYTFDRCSSLTGLAIPPNVASIGTYAFFRCYSLTNVSLPDGLTYIGVSAFYDCRSLSSVIIPHTVMTIDIQAFLSCTNLGRIVIGDGVTEIGDSAFLNCTSLTGVYFEGNAPVPGDSMFGYDVNAIVYYLPGTTGWGTTYGGRPTALWLPQPDNNPATFGIHDQQFGFSVNWARGRTTVVEACTNLSDPHWQPLSTNTPVSDSYYFTDRDWTNHPIRFYRVGWP